MIPRRTDIENPQAGSRATKTPQGNTSVHPIDDRSPKALLAGAEQECGDPDESSLDVDGKAMEKGA